MSKAVIFIIVKVAWQNFSHALSASHDKFVSLHKILVIKNAVRKDRGFTQGS